MSAHQETKVARPTNLKTASRLKEHIRSRKLGDVDAREWQAEWEDRWVVFVDLIAFAERSIRSRQVVLNNIVRFDRASAIARDSVPGIRTFRFSDSTFGIADQFGRALAFAVAIHHACLALNAEYMERVPNPLFIHMIVPKVTLAHGAVLSIPEANNGEKRFDGLDPRTLIAGAGIVKAYKLEKSSAGGLLTTDREGASMLKEMGLRGGPSSMQKCIAEWQQMMSKSKAPRGTLFIRDNFVDVPWLLLRPIQDDASNLWCAGVPDAAAATADYLKLWELGAREFYVSAGYGNPLDISKHFSAAIRHGINCAQARVGQRLAKYYRIGDALEMAKTGRTIVRLKPTVASDASPTAQRSRQRKVR